jgi:hypothetical protein
MYRTENRFSYNALVSMMAAQLFDAVIRETPANGNVRHGGDVAPAAGAARPQYPWSAAPGPLASELWS